jgi:hypothetical protein
MQEVKNDKKQTKGGDDSIYLQRRSEMMVVGQDDEGGDDELLNSESNKKPKLSIAALMFLFPLVVTADLFDSLSVTGIGVPIVWIISGTATGIVVLWLICVGMRADWVLAANLIDLIPVLSILPIKTACLVFVVLNERSNKFQKATRAAKKTLELKNKEKIINISDRENIKDKVA